MGTYDTLRQIADSWGLLAMFVFFVAMVLFVFRRGSRARYEEAAQVCGVAVGTIKSRIARGRAQLSELLGEDGSAGSRPDQL